MSALNVRLNIYNKLWVQHPVGGWVITDKRIGQLIGSCEKEYLDETDEYESGYALSKPYWGKGIATEAAHAATYFGFENAKLNRIIAVVVPDNTASWRVLEKIGFVYEKNAFYYDLDVVYYAITSEQFRKARQLPGVKAVVTGEDYPGLMGLYLTDRHIFCRERVRYVGDPVAGVAAISEEIAEQALDLIEVEYEDLPGIFDPELGAQPDAELIHPELGTYEVANFIFPEAGTNISNHFRIRKGDVDGAWAQCAAIVERSYRIPHVQHVTIEPHVAIAKAEEDGTVTLWGSSQSPFAQRNLIAMALGISHPTCR